MAGWSCEGSELVSLPLNPLKGTLVLSSTIIRIYIVPRWRGKYFNIKEFSDGGGQEVFRFKGNFKLGWT